MNATDADSDEPDVSPQPSDLPVTIDDTAPPPAASDPPAESPESPESPEAQDHPEHQDQQETEWQLDAEDLAAVQAWLILNGVPEDEDLPVEGEAAPDGTPDVVGADVAADKEASSEPSGGEIAGIGEDHFSAWYESGSESPNVESAASGAETGGEADATSGIEPRAMDDEPAPANPFPHLLIVPGTTLALEDAYLDTADWRLHRAGYTLRIRRRDGHAEATLKSMGAAVKGLRQRREITEALPGGAEPEALAALPGPVGGFVRLLAGTRPLRVCFELSTLRRPFAMFLEGEPAGEVVLDETTVAQGEDTSGLHAGRHHDAAGPQAGGYHALNRAASTHPGPLLRVEVEVPAALQSAFEPFVAALCEDCGLVPASLSKFEMGLQASGLSTQADLDFGSTRVDRAVTIGQAAYGALRRHFGAMLTAEPGTRLGEDSEALHEMRVATRRLRAASRLFEDLLPPEIERLNGELQWVAAALGDVRDRDVQMERLAAWAAEAPPAEAEALGELIRRLAERRKTARGRMLQVLDSSRYDTFLDALAAFLRAGPPPEPATLHEPATEHAPALIRKAYRKVRRMGAKVRKGSPPAAYHALRIATKRLRYAVEFLAPLYGKPAQAFIRRVVSLQDLLGRHQDADVAIHQLQEEVANQGSQLPGATLFAMGQVAERYAEDASRLRKAFPARYARIRGKSWRRMVAKMRAS